MGERERAKTSCLSFRLNIVCAPLASSLLSLCLSISFPQHRLRRQSVFHRTSDCPPGAPSTVPTNAGGGGQRDCCCCTICQSYTHTHSHTLSQLYNSGRRTKKAAVRRLGTACAWLPVPAPPLTLTLSFACQSLTLYTLLSLSLFLPLSQVKRLI